MNNLGQPDHHLVLLAPYDAAVWSDVLPLLQAVAAVTIVSPGDESDVASMATQALRVMPARCSVAGFCLGAHVALEIFRQAPDRISGVALLNAALAPDSLAQRRLREERVARLRAKAAERETPDEAYIGHAAPWLVSPQALVAPSMMKRVSDLLGKTPVLRSLTQQLAMLERPDNRRWLASGGESVLVVGADHDRICAPPRPEEIRSYAPLAQVRVLKGCGHLSPLERPAELAAALTEWLGARASPSNTHQFVEQTA